MPVPSGGVEGAEAVPSGGQQLACGEFVKARVTLLEAAVAALAVRPARALFGAGSVHGSLGRLAQVSWIIPRERARAGGALRDARGNRIG
jgi:hypothetical protein